MRVNGASYVTVNREVGEAESLHVQCCLERVH